MKPLICGMAAFTVTTIPILTKAQTETPPPVPPTFSDVSVEDAIVTKMELIVRTCGPTPAQPGVPGFVSDSNNPGDAEWQEGPASHDRTVDMGIDVFFGDPTAQNPLFLHLDNSGNNFERGDEDILTVPANLPVPVDELGLSGVTAHLVSRVSDIQALTIRYRNRIGDSGRVGPARPNESWCFDKVGLRINGELMFQTEGTPIWLGGTQESTRRHTFNSSTLRSDPNWRKRESMCFVDQIFKVDDIMPVIQSYITSLLHMIPEYNLEDALNVDENISIVFIAPSERQQDNSIQPPRYILKNWNEVELRIPVFGQALAPLDTEPTFDGTVSARIRLRCDGGREQILLKLQTLFTTHTGILSETIANAIELDVADLIDEGLRNLVKGVILYEDRDRRSLSPGAAAAFTLAGQCLIAPQLIHFDDLGQLILPFDWVNRLPLERPVACAPPSP